MKIIIVDDNADYRASLLRVLTSAGHTCMEAASWVDVGPLARQDPDLALVDATLPTMNGIELIGVIRRHWPKLDVILMMSEQTNDTLLQAKEAGAAGCVLKSDPYRVLNAVTALEESNRPPIGYA